MAAGIVNVRGSFDQFVMALPAGAWALAIFGLFNIMGGPCWRWVQR